MYSFQPTWRCNPQCTGIRRSVDSLKETCPILMRYPPETADLEAAHAEFTAAGGHARALVVINPGNPTGGVLPREAIESILAFAESKDLLVLADEAAVCSEVRRVRVRPLRRAA